MPFGQLRITNDGLRMKESAEPMVIYCFASEVTEKTEGKANSK